MDHWVMAFVGDRARENHRITRRTNTFCVSSNRNPIRRARPVDRVLFYLAGQGFVGSAGISSSAQTPASATEWHSKNPPIWQVLVEDLRSFPEPIPY